MAENLEIARGIDVTIEQTLIKNQLSIFLLECQASLLAFQNLYLVLL